MATGGSIESVTIAAAPFSCPADNDATLVLGGSVNEVQANGDGSARLIKIRGPWKVTGLQLVVNNLTGDHQFLQSLANGNGFFICTITLASQVVYKGLGQIVGEVGQSSNGTVVSLELSGQGELA